MISTRSTRPAGIRLSSTCEPAEALPLAAAELADTKRRPLTSVNVRCEPRLNMLKKRCRVQLIAGLVPTTLLSDVPNRGWTTRDPARKSDGKGKRGEEQVDHG